MIGGLLRARIDFLPEETINSPKGRNTQRDSRPCQS